ncbi:uncharacterized protein ACIB01_006653 [Guaruba guarouba]
MGRVLRGEPGPGACRRSGQNCARFRGRRLQAAREAGTGSPGAILFSLTDSAIPGRRERGAEERGSAGRGGGRRIPRPPPPPRRRREEILGPGGRAASRDRLSWEFPRRGGEGEGERRSPPAGRGRGFAFRSPASSLPSAAARLTSLLAASHTHAHAHGHTHAGGHRPSPRGRALPVAPRSLAPPPARGGTR